VLVAGDQVIARAFNKPIGSTDPTAHAEVLVLREAGRVLGNYRLADATVFVTVEPCLMCVGAMVHARVRALVYGATEPKAGAVVSAVRALEHPNLNHRFAVTGGVLEEECRAIIQEFFRQKRRGGRLEVEPSDPGAI
jgi:tRNA(adenine34) deaminase